MYNPHKSLILPEWKDKAFERDIGKYNNKSFMDGEGNFVGFLGEYITLDFKPYLIHVDQFNYDFVTKSKLTIDVKTKYTTYSGTPRPEWMASVCIDSKHQDVDFYFFCRVYRVGKSSPYQWPHGWLIGGLSKKEFMSKAKLYRKGEQEGDNGYIVRQDCYSLPYGELNPIKIDKV